MLRNEPIEDKDAPPCDCESCRAVWYGENAEIENGYDEAEDATDWMERQAELDLINSE